ncbi:hypothetical protein ACHWQZ_G006763 [Mnemiopsis leidyi]
MDIRRRMSMKKVIPRAITDFPKKDPRYALFAYFLKLANKCGANKFNNKRLPTEEDELFALTRLIRPEDIKVRDYNHQSILHLAAQYCSAEDILILLDGKFKSELELDATDELGYTPLMYAAMANNVDTAEVLVERECNLHLRAGQSERHALHVAAMFGCREMTRFLLHKKCDINCQDKMGLTPIALSAYYRHSNVTAFLVAMGADAFVVDNHGISSAIRIAYSMPVVIRDVFDKLCTEDVLKGERSYHLEKILDTEADVKTSLFQFLVWQGNLGIVEHPVFKHLTETKWLLYGEKPTKKTFGLLAVISIVWTCLYMITETYSETRKEKKYLHFIHLSFYIASFICYLQSLRVNTMLMRRRHAFLIHIRKTMTSMDKSEGEIMHPKGQHLMHAAREAHKTEKMTFINDIKKAPSLLTDLIIDHILLFYLIIKILSNFSTFIASIENIFGAIAIISLWTNAFLKLQITKKIGPFVIFMKYVPSDLWTVLTMFITLFMPALIVFYKTIFVKDSDLPAPEEEVLDRERRAAAGKGGSGGGGDSGSLDFLSTFFVVLRMVLVDYEYEMGKYRSEPPVWWMIISLVWIVVSSIIILNLMIAIMADSYTRIYERSEIASRVRRAETVADLEKRMGAEELDKVIGAIKERSPIRIVFDPVCDRDKIEIVEAKVSALTKKMNRLEQTINHKLFINLKRRLDFIETKVNIQSYKPGAAAPFFTYT